MNQWAIRLLPCDPREAERTKLQKKRKKGEMMSFGFLPVTSQIWGARMNLQWIRKIERLSRIPDELIAISDSLIGGHHEVHRARSASSISQDIHFFWWHDRYFIRNDNCFPPILILSSQQDHLVWGIHGDVDTLTHFRIQEWMIFNSFVVSFGFGRY